MVNHLWLLKRESFRRTWPLLEHELCSKWFITNSTEITVWMLPRPHRILSLVSVLHSFSVKLDVRNAEVLIIYLLFLKMPEANAWCEVAFHWHHFILVNHTRLCNCSETAILICVNCSLFLLAPFNMGSHPDSYPVSNQELIPWQ